MSANFQRFANILLGQDPPWSIACAGQDSVGVTQLLGDCAFLVDASDPNLQVLGQRDHLATARHLATLAMQRANLAGPPGTRTMGVAVVGENSSAPPVIAVQAPTSTWVERVDGDCHASVPQRVISLVAAAGGIAWDDDAYGMRRSAVLPDQCGGVFAGTADWAMLRGRSRIAAQPVLFPGAFNPLHDGHRTMARIAEQLTQRRVVFELSIENVDKPPLDAMHTSERAALFNEGSQLCLTRAATFTQKARLFPAATFVVGSDTMLRIGQSKYYEADGFERAVDALSRSSCRFLVFGRVIDGPFLSLDDLGLPRALRTLCEGVDASQFRRDISSTVLRKSRDQAVNEGEVEFD